MEGEQYYKGTEFATIDVALVTVKPYKENAREYGFKTASNIQVSVETETEDKNPLVVKGVLIAQKPGKATVTGNTIVMTDNVFNVELVQILQGGTIKKDSSTGAVTGYTPPVAGSEEEGEKFILNAYSAIYNAAGNITGYEKIAYPNCSGSPIAFNSQDGTWRAPQYTVNSAPNNGEAPYDMDIVAELPKQAVEEAGGL